MLSSSLPLIRHEEQNSNHIPIETPENVLGIFVTGTLIPAAAHEI